MVKENSRTDTAHNIVTEMVSGGAAKSRIAKALGVSDVTILYLEKKVNSSFGKIDELRNLYDQWKAGEIDLRSLRGKKSAEVTQTVSKKERVGNSTEVDVNEEKEGRTVIEGVGTTTNSIESILQEVDEEMIADVKRQIQLLEFHLEYLQDLISLRKKYGL